MVTAENLVEQHIQNFQVSYTFNSIMLLQEPLLVVAALYLFFLVVIIAVRLDFSITEVRTTTSTTTPGPYKDFKISHNFLIA